MEAKNLKTYLKKIKETARIRKKLLQRKKNEVFCCI